MHRTRQRVITWGLRVLLVAAIIGGWLYATGPARVSPLLLPKVSQVVSNLGTLLTSHELWSGAGVTVLEIVIAFAFSVAGGFTVGFWASRSRLRTVTVEPLLAWGYMAPLIVFYPLFILWFGVGMWSKIGYGAVSGFLPVAYNTVRGFRSVDARYIRVGTAFGASPMQLDWVVKLGASLPMVLAGIRIGTAINVITVILAEMLSATRGLGYELSQAAQLLNAGTSYALIVILLVIVACFQGLIQRITRRR
ncbi:MAG: ABC transporter permease [bacterium]|jgi:ABC-type nitrate/sulfonate/bicarbonate transport system permease component|nr:ABC transporter permease [bacterium]